MSSDYLAVKKAYPNANLIDSEKGVFDTSGNKIITEQSKIDAARVELDADYAKVKYKDDRKAEYPSIADQLDDLYHNGIDGWKATIKTTKDKYPKS
tara:strand:+ start:507 stop:794 length:288 start_codon:yes stop_codon:yes gene_type:complete